MATELNDFLAAEGGPTDADPSPAVVADPALAADLAAPVEEPTPPEPPVVDEPPEEIPEDLRGTRDALLAERAKRKDWKGQADRLSGELTATKAALDEATRKAALPPPAPPAPAAEAAPPMVIPSLLEDPVGYHAYMQRQIFNERLENSELRLRDKFDDVDAKIEVFKKAADANPALRAELSRQRDPYRWAYDYAKRTMAQEEIGDDPAAFRAKIEAEVRAKVEAEYAAAGADPVQVAAPALRIPRSLGTAPSVAPRMQAVADPMEFEDIFKRAPRRA